jgi:hypothetical protein
MPDESARSLRRSAMRNASTMRAVLTAVAATATAIVLGVAMTMMVSGPSMATPAIASKMGKPCTTCHTAPPTLNAYGKKYKKSMKK